KASGTTWSLPARRPDPYLMIRPWSFCHATGPAVTAPPRPGSTSAEGGLMLRIADIMTRNVETVGPSATVQEAAERMKSDNIGSLPVCLDSRLVGTITDRDITVRVTAEGRDARATLVRDVMTQPVVTIRPQQELADAEQLMHDHQVRRLPVVEQD